MPASAGVIRHAFERNEVSGGQPEPLQAVGDGLPLGAVQAAQRQRQAGVLHQAEQLGWAAHGMTGFDHTGIYAALGVPAEGCRVEAAVAIGRKGDPASLPEALAAREKPSDRLPLAGLAFEGSFKAE